LPAPTPGRRRAYCTYFDSGYLSRGLTLIESLRQHGDHGDVWVLALDDQTKRYLDEAALPGVTAITIGDIEAAEPELAPLKSQRSRMEYYFTATPLLMRWVMNRQADDTVVVYLDADLFFFDDPERVLDALGDGAVGIIEHRYPASRAKALAKYGRFNVGWVGIRCDDRGRACVDWWSSRTLEWCSDKPEDGKYADQGYLDSFPALFDGVVVLEPLGMNLAPWNTAGVTIARTGELVLVGERRDRLVFFHFHGLRRVRDWYVSSQLIYRAPMSRVLRDWVYTPYVRALSAADARVKTTLPVALAKPRGNGLRGIVSRMRKALVDTLSIATRNAVRIQD
jgi:hypothetical protein